jgi:hypothetical protein
MGFPIPPPTYKGKRFKVMIVPSLGCRIEREVTEYELSDKRLTMIFRDEGGRWLETEVIMLTKIDCIQILPY